MNSPESYNSHNPLPAIPTAKGHTTLEDTAPHFPWTIAPWGLRRRLKCRTNTTPQGTILLFLTINPATPKTPIPTITTIREDTITEITTTQSERLKNPPSPRTVRRGRMWCRRTGSTNTAKLNSTWKINTKKNRTSFVTAHAENVAVNAVKYAFFAVNVSPFALNVSLFVADESW